MADVTRYRGQWGGKIENGEEMWWSEPDRTLQDFSFWSRVRFGLDTRHHFILRFWRACRGAFSDAALSLADYGCGTGGTTINFSRAIGQPISGYDVFATQIEVARHFAADAKSSCRFGLLDEAGKIPVADGALHGVFSMDVLGHVKDIPVVLREWARALRSGGMVLLFTEANYSAGDRSIAARLAARGADVVAAVPEHISLFPREELERMFVAAGFRVEERFSANVWHFFFFPKDYILLLKGRPEFRGWYHFARVWNVCTKLVPFYPKPFHMLRILVTHLLGRRHKGTAYYYRLVKN